jgi:hypothetical protein
MADGHDSGSSTKRKFGRTRKKHPIEATARAEAADAAELVLWPSVLRPSPATRAVAKARVEVPGVVAEVDRAGVSVAGVVALVDPPSRPITDDEVDEILAFAYPKKIPTALVILERFLRLRQTGLLPREVELPSEGQIKRVRAREHNRNRLLRGRPTG